MREMWEMMRVKNIYLGCGVVGGGRQCGVLCGLRQYYEL